MGPRLQRLDRNVSNAVANCFDKKSPIAVLESLGDDAGWPDHINKPLNRPSR
jgi:hypothetical protein